MCSLFEHAHVLLIVLVYLAALKYLQADSAILVVCEEWSTTWFSHVLNHSTNTYRTVEFLLEEDYQLGIFKFLDVILLAAEVILHKADDLLKSLMTVGTALKHLKIVEHLLLKSNQDTCNYLFVCHCLRLQTVWHHIVNVLDEHHIGRDFIEVLNECSMSSWTEQ